MENHLPDLPTASMPTIKPPRKRRKRGLVLALTGGGFLLLCLALGLASFLLRTSPSPIGDAQKSDNTQTVLQRTQIVRSSPSAFQGTQISTSSTPTPASSALPQTGQPSATHGRPHLGGPFSDFVGKYGPPNEQGDTSGQNFWIGTDQAIDLNISSDTQGEVTQLAALGPTSWNSQQAEQYCLPFLPNRATQFKATTTQRAYHSDSGDVLLTVQAHSCLLLFARA